MSREAGYDAFLPKPVDWSRLAALLEQYLKLEWAYAGEPHAAEEPVTLVAPPEQELAALYELAAIGDIVALQERAAQLEQQDPQWGPFARRPALLAARFELERLQGLLNEYLPPDS